MKNIGTVDFAKYLQLDPAVMPKYGFKKLSDLDKDKTCKNRKVFPFFSQGFVDLYRMLYLEDSPNQQPLQVYMQSLHKCEHNNKQADYAPLMVFDLLVLSVFHEKQQGTKELKAIKYLMGDDLKKRKQEIVRSAKEKVDILFLQEADDVLFPVWATKDREDLRPKSKFGGRVAMHQQWDNKKNKWGDVDTAILDFGKKRSRLQLNSSDEGSSTPEALYTEWLAFVEKQPKPTWERKSDGEAAQTVRADGGSNNEVYLPEGFLPEYKPKGGFEDIYNVLATSVAIANIGGQSVMLMSMHPKSNGRPCVFFAFMAKEFFEARKKDLGLSYLLLGMDANVLPIPEDSPEKSGFTWAQFEAKTTGMGFLVVNQAETNTVWKERSFLQTQINKAAKRDQTIKDIMLLYHTDKKMVDTIEVVNVAPDHDHKSKNCFTRVYRAEYDFSKPKPKRKATFKEDFGYIGDVPFPTVNWPLDHSMTVAELNPASLRYMKEHLEKSLEDQWEEEDDGAVQNNGGRGQKTWTRNGKDVKGHKRTSANKKNGNKKATENEDYDPKREARDMEKYNVKRQTKKLDKKKKQHIKSNKLNQVVTMVRSAEGQRILRRVIRKVLRTLHHGGSATS